MTSERLRLLFRDRRCIEPLFYPGKAHGFLCAPARSGKFTCALAYMLGEFAGSCLTIDPKGQACAVTARWRHEVLGQKVYRIDPMNLLETLPGVKWCPPRARFDPLGTLDPNSPTFGADADSIAEACVPSGQYTEPHWPDGGRRLASGVIMALKARWPRETLVSAYRVISGRDVFTFAADMCEWAETNGAGFIAERLAPFGGPGASENKEILSMVSTAATAMQFIGNQCIADSLSGSTLTFEAMKRERITVYLVLPGQYLGGSCMKWFRLVAASFVGAMMREPSRDVPVLGILDEYKAAVGKVGVIEAAMGLGAGFNFRLLPVVQDLNQLRELHPEGWQTYLANAGAQIFFAPRDKTTSDYISDMTGEREVRSIAKSLSNGRDGETVVGLSFAQHARRYMLPYETRELGDDEALVFGENIPGVIRAGRKPYYLTREFNFDPDPYEFSSARMMPKGGTMDFKPRSEQEIADSRLLPKGVYQFDVLEAWDKKSQAGNPMIELKLRVSNGDGQTRIVSDYLLEQRAEKLRHAAAACGVLEQYKAGHLAESDFRGKQGRLRLTTEKKKGFAPRNVVADYVGDETTSSEDFEAWSRKIAR